MITYNHEPYIAKSVQGIVSQQTSFPFELLVSDDCSTDGTRAVVDQFWRKHPNIIKPLHSERNLGAKGNIQKLTTAAKAPFTAYCEGDDVWHDPTKLQQQADFLVAHSEYALVHSHCHAYYVTRNRLIPNAHRVSRRVRDEDGYSDILMGRRAIWTLTACVRTDVQKRVLEEAPECSDRRWKMGDTQRWLEIARRGKVKCIHQALATRNFLSESATRSVNAEKVLQFRLNGLALIEHYLTKYPCSAEVAAEAKANCINTALDAACTARNLPVAQGLFERARRERLPLPPTFYLSYLSLKYPLLGPLFNGISLVGEGVKHARHSFRTSLKSC